MELTIERVERNCRYAEDSGCDGFVIKESIVPDYTSAMILLRNLGERRDTTSLEREAIATAIRLLKQNADVKKP